MNNGWLEGCIIIVYIEGSCFYVVSLYCCLVTVAFARQMSLDLHRVYQLTSYHCIDPPFPCGVIITGKLELKGPIGR